MSRRFKNLKFNSTKRNFLRVRQNARWPRHRNRLANEERQVELRILKPIMFNGMRKHGDIWKHGANLVHASDVIGMRMRKKNGPGFQTGFLQERQQWFGVLAWINHPTCEGAVLPMFYANFYNIGVGLAATQFESMKFDG